MLLVVIFASLLLVPIHDEDSKHNHYLLRAINCLMSKYHVQKDSVSHCPSGGRDRRAEKSVSPWVSELDPVRHFWSQAAPGHALDGQEDNGLYEELQRQLLRSHKAALRFLHAAVETVLSLGNKERLWWPFAPVVWLLSTCSPSVRQLLTTTLAGYVVRCVCLTACLVHPSTCWVQQL